MATSRRALSAGKKKQQPAAMAPSAPSGGVAKPQRAPTDFERRLYQACMCIPKSKVSTYGTLAKILGSSPRAVGQGMRRNPYAPTVPCHRVVAADGSLGGFCGSWGEHSCEVVRKRNMLVGEGVSVQGIQVAPECLIKEAELEKLIAKAQPFVPPSAAPSPAVPPQC